jgi:hypothetical protein
MKAIYKSTEGERLVRERYQAFLKNWPVPNEQIHVPTRQGSTFVVISGPNGAPPLLLFHGGAFNSAMVIASPGIDWAGKLVEKVSGITLEQYFQRNILEPLGVQDTTFVFPD